MATDDAYIQQILYKIVVFSGTLVIVWYSRRFIMHHTYKRIYAWALNKFGPKLNRLMRKEKRKVFKTMHRYQANLNKGLRVLEVGSGSAANIDFFPYNTELVCLDPNPHFVGYIKRNLKKGETVVSAEIVQGCAERMIFEDGSFDAVVCTLVLCTVCDVEKSLKEIYRVLKPGGLFIFLEHVGAPEHTLTRRFQRTIQPLHMAVADGCDPSRDTGKLIENVGFATINIELFQKKLRFVPWITHWIMGTAMK